LDLSFHQPINLDGPRSLEIARAWCAALLTTGEPGDAELLTTASTKDSLFADLAPTTAVQTTGDLDALLMRIEAEVLSRSRILADVDLPNLASYKDARPEDPIPFTLVIIEQLPHNLQDRWHAISHVIAPLGIAALTLGRGDALVPLITTDDRLMVNAASPQDMHEVCLHIPRK
jgi:hypothetical protein